MLLITHYTRILQHITPGLVHVFAGGRIVESGGPELADELENRPATCASRTAAGGIDHQRGVADAAVE